MRTNRVLELRKLIGLTQQQLSDLTGIPRSTLGEIEIHKRLLHPEQIEVLSKVFKLTDTEELFR